MKTKLLFGFLFISLFAGAQTAKDYAVLIQATVSESPASITLNWNVDSSCTSQAIYRKSKTFLAWGVPIATVGKYTRQFVDNNVTVGVGYEYYVRRIYASRTGHGYAYAGIKLPEQAAKGKLLLLVDQNYASPLAAEIAQLSVDLVADGWSLKRVDVDRAASVTSVKGIIKAAYAEDPTLKAIYLLGRIPVPYSGAFTTSGTGYYPPDGHPDHGGAWPADMFYGCLNEAAWTDSQVNDTTPSRKQNDNIPGDGKYDVVYIYSDTVAFQIGRVDLTNMPLFGMSDTLLVKQYLNKAHQFKIGNTPVVRRGLIDDNFGAMSGEAFASTAWRDFSVMFGDSVFSRDYLTSTKQGNYLFSYGCGAGSYTSCSGVGTSTNFNNDSINTTFTALFGSYFGDWDAQNDLLRAPLCNKTTLTSAWSGRPYWMFHHMALGENIGYAARLTQNNYSDFPNGGNMGYAYNTAPTFVTIALMGDPSLRLHPFKPVGAVTASESVDSIGIDVAWTAAPEADSYAILRGNSASGPFKIIGRVSNSTFTYTDALPNTGMNYYMVRPVKLEQTPSGTYLNMALGVMDSAYSINPNGVAEQQQLPVRVYPNPSNGILHIEVASKQQFTLIDLLGRVVYESEILSGHNQLLLPQSLKGIFLYRTSGASNSVSSGRLVIE